MRVVLSLPFYFLYNHDVVGFFPLDCFLIGAHNSLWLLVGKNALEVVEQLVELLVMEPRLGQMI